MRISREEAYMRMAEVAAQRSTCSRLHVGVVITNDSMTNPLAIGYNGQWSGGPNTCDRPDLPGGCQCVHAEMGAITKASYGQPLVVFTTHSPCVLCAKLLINAGVTRVFYRSFYRDPEGLNILSLAGVDIINLERESEEDGD